MSKKSFAEFCLVLFIFFDVIAFYFIYIAPQQAQASQPQEISFIDDPMYDVMDIPDSVTPTPADTASTENQSLPPTPDTINISGKTPQKGSAEEAYTANPLAYPLPLHSGTWESINGPEPDSEDGNHIFVYRFGNGPKKILLIGGVHANEYSSIQLVGKIIAMVDSHPEIIPADIQLEIIPILNVDGFTYNTFRASRFDANDVDLYRNFDFRFDPCGGCGKFAFSEKQSAALRDFVLKEMPIFAIDFHGATNAEDLGWCVGTGVSKYLKGNQTAIDADRISNKLAGDIVKRVKYHTNTGPVLSGTTGMGREWLSSVGIPTVVFELWTPKNYQMVSNIDNEFPRNLDDLTFLLNWTP